MQTEHWAIADATQQLYFRIPVAANASRYCGRTRVRIVHLIHVRRLYQIRRVLSVDAEEVLEIVDRRAVGVRIVARRIRIERSAEAVPRIVRIDATRFGVVGIDDFQVIVGASDGFGSESKNKIKIIEKRWVKLFFRAEATSRTHSGSLSMTNSSNSSTI